VYILEETINVPAHVQKRLGVVIAADDESGLIEFGYLLGAGGSA